MRGKHTFSSSRWSMDYELRSISRGIEEDLQQPLGQYVMWYRWSLGDTDVDPTYDVGFSGGGRRWHDPFKVMVVHASVGQGPQFHNDRGFYTVDELTLVLNASEVMALMPSAMLSPDPLIKDRIVFLNQVYTPSSIAPHAHLRGRVATVAVSCLQVKPEEMVNDPQFDWVVSRHPDGDFDSADFSAADFSTGVGGEFDASEFFDEDFDTGSDGEDYSGADVQQTIEVIGGEEIPLGRELDTPEVYPPDTYEPPR